MIRTLEWQTDRHGKLCLGGIHDGSIEAFGYATGALTFAIRGLGGELTTFVASQVYVMCITQLWEGTIVS